MPARDVCDWQPLGRQANATPHPHQLLFSSKKLKHEWRTAHICLLILLHTNIPIFTKADWSINVGRSSNATRNPITRSRNRNPKCQISVLAQRPVAESSKAASLSPILDMAEKVENCRDTFDCLRFTETDQEEYFTSWGMQCSRSHRLDWDNDHAANVVSRQHVKFRLDDRQRSSYKSYCGLMKRAWCRWPKREGETSRPDHRLDETRGSNNVSLFWEKHRYRSLALKASFSYSGEQVFAIEQRALMERRECTWQPRP